nr:hypothetical protein [Halomonas olivaria]
MKTSDSNLTRPSAATAFSFKLDVSVFHPRYRNDATGWLAYDSAILLKIILFAYSKGITSSREMQWCCDTVPHFTTLASFVSRHADEIEALFIKHLLVF